MFTWLFVGLAIWSIYRRVRRIIGTQIFHQGWAVFRLSFLLFGIFLVFLPRLAHMENIQFVLLGTAIGGGMVYFMVRFTKFWVEGSNIVYKSNPYLGCFILIAVLTRFIYKIPVLLSLTDWLSHSHERAPDLNALRTVMDPLSTVLIVMLLIYFLGSNLYVFWGARRLRAINLADGIRQKSYANDSSSQE